jgi:hypothetical protein
LLILPSLSLPPLEEQLMRFQERYQRSAKPFEWTFTRAISMACSQSLGKNLAALPPRQRQKIRHRIYESEY